MTLVVAIILLLGTSCTVSQRVTTNKVKVKIGQNELRVEVARTLAEQAKGLSGQTSLGEDEGMLFVFTNKQITTFWMKGMSFPLDFIWLADDKVVEIAENIQPPPAAALEQNLPIYQPIVPVDQVLEVNAGWVARHGVKVGERVEVISND